MLTRGPLVRTQAQLPSCPPSSSASEQPPLLSAAAPLHVPAGPVGLHHRDALATVIHCGRVGPSGRVGLVGAHLWGKEGCNSGVEWGGWGGWVCLSRGWQSEPQNAASRRLTPPPTHLPPPPPPHTHPPTHTLSARPTCSSGGVSPWGYRKVWVCAPTMRSSSRISGAAASSRSAS